MDAKIIERTMLDYFRLVGKTAIVTGAGNGMGRAISELLAGLGVNVVGCDIEEDSIQETGRLVAEAGGTMIPMCCDVRKYEDIQRVIDKTVESFGTVDILVNNAAGCGGGVTVDTINEEEWMRLIELNLCSVYRFTISVLPIMRAKGAGKIINISSGAAVIGDVSDPHYAAAKGGVLSLTKELARELAKEHIHVNCVCPGLCDTRMAHIRPWEDEVVDMLWDRIGQPRDMACAVAYLASDASDYLTGQTISPNGGAWMQ